MGPESDASALSWPPGEGMNDSIDDALGAVRRSETPEILFPDDLALHLRLDAETVRMAMIAGSFGPWFAVNGEPAVQRQSFRTHLRLRMAQRRLADRESLRQCINRWRGPSPTAGPRTTRS